MSARVATVTGASAGLGRAIAVQFGAEGWSVGIGARRSERLGETADKIESTGSAVLAHALDVADPVSVNAFFDAVEHDLGPSRAVIANAGVGRLGPIAAQSDADMRAVVETNLLGVLYTARRAIAGFDRLDGPADLVFVSSDSVERPVPHLLTYAATKAAVEYVAAGLRIELEDRPIRVTTLRLGPVASEFGAGFDLSNWEETARTWKHHGIHLADAVLQPADVAAAVIEIVTAPADVEHRHVTLGPTGRSEL